MYILSLLLWYTYISHSFSSFWYRCRNIPVPHFIPLHFSELNLNKWRRQYEGHFHILTCFVLFLTKVLVYGVSAGVYIMKITKQLRCIGKKWKRHKKRSKRVFLGLTSIKKPPRLHSLGEKKKLGLKREGRGWSKCTVYPFVLDIKRTGSGSDLRDITNYA